MIKGLRKKSFFFTEKRHISYDNGMKQTPWQLIEQYASCPSQENAYEIDGKSYAVTRYFTGVKNANQAIAELAVSQANRDMRLREEGK